MNTTCDIPAKIRTKGQAAASYYRPQTKFAKVMFLHVSVCPRGGGGCLGPYPGEKLGGLAEGGGV